MVRKRALAVCAGLTFFVSILAAPVSAETVEWNVGDFWEYGWDAAEEGMSLSGTMKMEVARTTSVQIAGQSHEAFILDISGEATVTGAFDTITVSGTMTMSGSQTRLASNLSLVSLTLIMSMSIAGTGMTMTMDMGTEEIAASPMMDLPGSENLSLGATFVTDTSITSTTWINVLGSNQTDSMTSSVTSTITVAAIDVSTTTDAGTFSCAKLAMTSDGSGPAYYYYSPKVGNYVKISGADSLEQTGFASFGDIVLKDYRYGGSGGGVASYFTGKNVWVSALIIVIVVALIALTLAMRGRRTPAPFQQQPQGQDLLPPPPPTG
jgi:hypothetical protein